MDIKTKFNLHDTVYHPNYQNDCIEKLHITKIEVSTEFMYSGSGGCCGISENVVYFDEDAEVRQAQHNLCSTKEECKAKLVDYKKRFPTVLCSHCKGKGKVARNIKQK